MTTTGRQTGPAPIYEAVEVWKNRSLLGGKSLLVPDVNSWEPEVFGELVDHFTENPDLSKDDFYTKLARQRVFFLRRNDSTVAFADNEQEALDEYLADRWIQREAN